MGVGAGRAGGGARLDLTVSLRIHPTAIVEDGVAIGEGTSIWDSVHVRGPGTTIGRDCTIGEKSHLAYGVTIGDRCKLNAFVYVCTAVTIGDGVMLSAGTTFTNDRFPRATTPDLSELLSPEPDEDTIATTVGDGVTVGARAVIGPGCHLGRFAMVGMGSVVTRPVPDFALVLGNPARVVGAVCRCGQPTWRAGGDPGPVTCRRCGRSYEVSARGAVVEVGA